MKTYKDSKTKEICRKTEILALNIFSNVLFFSKTPVHSIAIFVLQSKLYKTLCSIDLEEIN